MPCVGCRFAGDRGAYLLAGEYGGHLRVDVREIRAEGHLALPAEMDAQDARQFAQRLLLAEAPQQQVAQR